MMQICQPGIVLWLWCISRMRFQTATNTSSGMGVGLSPRGYRIIIGAIHGSRKSWLQQVTGRRWRSMCMTWLYSTMPSRSAGVCMHPGCQRLVVLGSRCERHKRVAVAKNAEALAKWRADTDERRRNDPGRAAYKTARWQRARAAFLAEHPMCVSCGGIANTVDHIAPKDGRDEGFWDSANWQAMCQR